MSELTVEQAKLCLSMDTDNPPFENCSKCLLANKCDNCYWNKPYFKIANDMAIKALEENDGLHWRIKALENAMKDCAEECDRLRKENEKLKSEMSAVEVLEWLKCGCYDERFADILESDCARDIYEVFDELTSEEIVEKIKAYKRGKDNNVTTNLNSDTGTKERTKEESKSVEFNVGDFVECFGETHRIIDIDYNFETAYKLENLMWYGFDELEHAEPPKEEPQIEWVWGAYDFGNHRLNKEFRTEQEAIDYIEQIVGREFGANKAQIRRVCRKKTEAIS